MKKEENYFDGFKATDHSQSFERVEGWMRHQKPKNMIKSVYKIAATLLVASFIAIACTVPVDTTEEVGFILRGTSNQDIVELAGLVEKYDWINPSQMNVEKMVYEVKGEDPKVLFEFLIVLPENKKSETVQLVSDLESELPGLQTIDIHPITEDVERTLFDTALIQLDIKGKNPDLDNIQLKVNELLKEHADSPVEAYVFINPDGEPVIEIVSEGQILDIPSDANENHQVIIKRTKGPNGEEIETIEEVIKE